MLCFLHSLLRQILEDIFKEEVIWALKNLKSGKAAGPSEATTEMFLTACDVGVNILISCFENVMRDGTPPGELIKSITIHLFKVKGTHLSVVNIEG